MTIRQADIATEEWLRVLSAPGPDHEDGLARLHELLLRVAQREMHRRGGSSAIAGPEADDLAHQAAADAMVSVLRKLPTFRGESRFTTWAYSFVMFEVSGKIARHRWTGGLNPAGSEDWEQLPDRFGLDPGQQAEWGDLVRGVQNAVRSSLSEHQRRVFVAIVLDGVPLDVVAAELGATRNAVYKVMFDARRKLRAALVEEGLLDSPGTGLQ